MFVAHTAIISTSLGVYTSRNSQVAGRPWGVLCLHKHCTPSQEVLVNVPQERQTHAKMPRNGKQSTVRKTSSQIATLIRERLLRTYLTSVPSANHQDFWAGNLPRKDRIKVAPWSQRSYVQVRHRRPSKPRSKDGRRRNHLCGSMKQHQLHPKGRSL